MHFVKHYPSTVNVLMDDFFNSFNGFEKGFHSLPANIFEEDGAFKIEILAAGRQKENFKIETENGLLAISYEEKETTETTSVKTLKQEFKIKNFKRSFKLDDTVDADNIEAVYQNGILSIKIPKKQTEQKAVKIVSIK